jgi:hypothetical protein
MPPDMSAGLDASLREIEADLAETVGLTRFYVEKFERPDIWTRELDRGVDEEKGGAR